MTIHHDKLAYGKLASSMQEMSEDEISEMLKLINADEEDCDAKKEETEKNNKNNIKK